MFDGHPKRCPVVGVLWISVNHILQHHTDDLVQTEECSEVSARKTASIITGVPIMVYMQCLTCEANLLLVLKKPQCHNFAGLIQGHLVMCMVAPVQNGVLEERIVFLEIFISVVVLKYVE